MGAEPSGGVHATAQKRLVVLVVALPIIIWLLPALLDARGLPSRTVTGLTGIALLGWAIFGSCAVFSLACPNCGRLLFMRGGLATTLWPPRECSKCGHDLTRA